MSVVQRSKPWLLLCLIGPLLVTGVLWKLSQRRPYLIGTPRLPASALAVSHDGNLVAYSGEAANIATLPSLALWSRSSNQFVPLQWKFATTRNSKKSYSFNFLPTQLEFSSDGKIVTAAYINPALSQFAVAAWDTATGRQLWNFDGLKKMTSAGLFLSPQGQQLAVCDWENERLTVFDLSRPQRITNSKDALARDFPVRLVLPVLAPCAAWTPDGGILAVYTGPHIEFWDMKKNTRVLPDTPALPSSGGGRQMSWSPDGRLLATSDTVALAIWDTTTRRWRSVAHTSNSNYGAFSLAWIPNSQFLWVGGVGATQGTSHVQLWSAPDLKVIRDVPTSGPVAVSGDGSTIATRNLDGKSNSVWLWNIG